MKPKRNGTMQVIDAATGEVIEERHNAFAILPPLGDVCGECGTDHAWDRPHDQQSLVYQMQFRATHGRWPTWSDAMAHCPEPIRRVWRETLREQLTELGQPIPADLAEAEDGKGGGRG